MTREQLFDFARERWGTVPDHPFRAYPEAAALRHPDSGRWFALIMPIPPGKLGLSVRDRGSAVDIVNLKCQPPLVTMLLEKEGVFPAYHMNRRHWVSVLLDSAFPEEELFELLELSWRLTAPRRTVRHGRLAQNRLS